MLPHDTKHYHAEELAEFLGSPKELVYWLIDKEVLTPIWIETEPWFSEQSLDELFKELGILPQVYQPLGSFN